MKIEYINKKTLRVSFLGHTFVVTLEIKVTRK